MSDLGPFVAAHLRDKVIADLLQENEKLKAQLRCARRIAITGPGGSPVYVQTDFSKGRYDPSEQSGEWWEVPFTTATADKEDGDAKATREVAEVEEDRTTTTACLLSSLPSCEIRIGSFVKLKVGEFDHLCVCHYSRELSVVKIKYCNIDPCVEVGVHIPMCEQLFMSIHSRTQRMEMGSSFFMDLIPTDQNPVVQFQELTFHADAARQALLDFGISNVEWLDREDANEEGSSPESLGKNYGTRSAAAAGKATGSTS